MDAADALPCRPDVTPGLFATLFPEGVRKLAGNIHIRRTDPVGMQPSPGKAGGKETGIHTRNTVGLDNVGQR